MYIFTHIYIYVYTYAYVHVHISHWHESFVCTHKQIIKVIAKSFRAQCSTLYACHRHTCQAFTCKSTR